jgi:hypothetical protein
VEAKQASEEPADFGQIASRFGKSDKVNCHENVTGNFGNRDHVGSMNQSSVLPICYLDPAVEDALYKPGETAGCLPTHSTDAMADDLASEWVESESRPTWLDNL